MKPVATSPFGQSLLTSSSAPILSSCGGALLKQGTPSSSVSSSSRQNSRRASLSSFAEMHSRAVAHFGSFVTQLYNLWLDSGVPVVEATAKRDELQCKLKAINDEFGADKRLQRASNYLQVRQRFERKCHDLKAEATTHFQHFISNTDDFCLCGCRDLAQLSVTETRGIDVDDAKCHSLGEDDKDKSAMITLHVIAKLRQIEAQRQKWQRMATAEGRKQLADARQIRLLSLYDDINAMLSQPVACHSAADACTVAVGSEMTAALTTTPSCIVQVESSDDLSHASQSHLQSHSQLIPESHMSALMPSVAVCSSVEKIEEIGTAVGCVTKKSGDFTAEDSSHSSQQCAVSLTMFDLTETSDTSSTRANAPTSAQSSRLSISDLVDQSHDDLAQKSSNTGATVIVSGHRLATGNHNADDSIFAIGPTDVEQEIVASVSSVRLALGVCGSSADEGSDAIISKPMTEPMISASSNLPSQQKKRSFSEMHNSTSTSTEAPVTAEPSTKRLRISTVVTDGRAVLSRRPLSDLSAMPPLQRQRQTPRITIIPNSLMETSSSNSTTSASASLKTTAATKMSNVSITVAPEKEKRKTTADIRATKQKPTTIEVSSDESVEEVVLSGAQKDESTSASAPVVVHCGREKRRSTSSRLSVKSKSPSTSSRQLEEVFVVQWSQLSQPEFEEEIELICGHSTIATAQRRGKWPMEELRCVSYSGVASHTSTKNWLIIERTAANCFFHYLYRSHWKQLFHDTDLAQEMWFSQYIPGSISFDDNEEVSVSVNGGKSLFSVKDSQALSASKSRELADLKTKAVRLCSSSQECVVTLQCVFHHIERPPTEVHLCLRRGVSISEHKLISALRNCLKGFKVPNPDTEDIELEAPALIDICGMRFADFVLPKLIEAPIVWPIGLDATEDCETAAQRSGSDMVAMAVESCKCKSEHNKFVDVYVCASRNAFAKCAPSSHRPTSPLLEWVVRIPVDGDCYLYPCGCQDYKWQWTGPMQIRIAEVENEEEHDLAHLLLLKTMGAEYLAQHPLSSATVDCRYSLDFAKWQEDDARPWKWHRVVNSTRAFAHGSAHKKAKKKKTEKNLIQRFVASKSCNSMAIAILLEEKHCKVYSENLKRRQVLKCDLISG